MPIPTIDSPMYNASQAFAGVPYAPTVSPTSNWPADKSVHDTIQKMAALARSNAEHPTVIAAVKDATQSLLPTATDREICTAIFYWIKDHVQFVEDETLNQVALGMSEYDAIDTELLIAPSYLLSMQHPMGDCDDFSTLCAAMLLVLRFKVAFVTIAADQSEPNRLSHVYVKVWMEDENKGMYLDCSHGAFPDWEHGEYTRKLEWGIS